MSNPIPGLDSLGYGYDVFGRYANTEFAKKRLFDFSGEQTIKIVDKEYTAPNRIEFRFDSENIFNKFSGKKVNECYTAISLPDTFLELD